VKNLDKKVSLFLRILVTIGLLYYLFKRVPYRDLIDIFVNSDKIYIFLSFLIFFISISLGMLRWRFLLHSLGLKVTYPEATGTYLSCYFFNLFFPSFVAGDVFRGASIASRHGEMKKVFSSVLMDRFSGAFGLALVTAISFILAICFNFFESIDFPYKEVAGAIFSISAIVALASLFIFSKRVFSFSLKILKKESALRNKLINFHDQLYFFRKKPKVFLKSLCYSIPIQMLAPIAFFISSKAFGLDLGFVYFLILTPIIMAIAIIPISIAGLGIRENAAVFFFCLVGVKANIGTGMSLLNGAFLILLGVFGGLFYVSLYHRWIQSRT